MGSKTVFLGIVDLLKVAASPCTWLHGCRPAAPPLKRQPRRKGSSTAAPRPRDAAMALSGRRRGGRQLAAGTPANVILCTKPRPPRPPPRRPECWASRAAREQGPTSSRTTTVLCVVDRPRAGRETRRGRERVTLPRAAGRRPLARWRSLRGERSGELDWTFPVPRRRVCAAHPLAFVLRRTPGARSHSPPHVRRRRLGTCKLTTCLG